MDGITGGRWQASYATREYHHKWRGRYTRWSFSQLCCTGWKQYQWLAPAWRNWKWRKWRWACGHTLRDHVRNDYIRERLKVENITERGAGKQDWGGLDTSRGETKNTSEERLWRWYHLKEESEEDRSRDERTVSTGTWELSGQQKIIPWQNWLEENCVCRSDPTTEWERLEEEDLTKHTATPTTSWTHRFIKYPQRSVEK